MRLHEFLSASDFNEYIRTKNDLTDEQRKLLERARDELQAHDPKLMTNAEFYIQCQADASRDVWFVVGNGQNKFICYMGSDGEPVAYLEQGSEKRSWLSADVRQQVVSRTGTVMEEGAKVLVKDLLPAAVAMAAGAALTNQSAR